jgi:hypothetical protein
MSFPQACFSRLQGRGISQIKSFQISPKRVWPASSPVKLFTEFVRRLVDFLLKAFQRSLE